MEQIEYKGFKLQAKPEYENFSRRWQIRVLISRNTGFTATAKSFSASNTYATEQEAMQHSINYGKQIIDGQIAGITMK